MKIGSTANLVENQEYLKVKIMDQMWFRHRINGHQCFSGLIGFICTFGFVNQNSNLMLLKNTRAFALTLLLSSCLIFSSAELKSQGIKEIRQAAENFCTLHNNATSEIAFSDQRMLSHHGDTTILLLQITNGGFIAMSAGKNTQPVLAYSFQGYHDLNNIPAPVQNWFKAVSEKISQAKNNPKAEKQWNALLSKNTTSGVRSSFLLTTKWGQGCHYNELCPEDDNGPCEHAVVGCVATAAAQIMNHWEHPQFGTGTHSYDAPSYGTQTADFGSTEYLWDQMPDSVGEQNIPVATLMYHCGVAYEMQYSASSSGSAIAAQPLEDYFSYSPNAHRILSGYYTDAEWINTMKQEIDAGRPVLYAGFNDDMGTSEGHAWVCDGYDNQDYLHFNWGWNSFGGFYALTESLYPDDNVAVIEIMPIKQFDVTPTSIIQPYSQTFTEPAQVLVTLENYGSDTISDIPASLLVNGTVILTETVTDTILPYEALNYAFNDSIDLTGMSGQDIDVSIITNLPGDQYSSNDSLTKQIRNVACASMPYENDFSLTDDFIGWLTEDANDDGNTWFHSYTNSEDLIYQGNENPADDWIFTQCLELEPEKMYKLSFDYASTGSYWPQNLEIHLGNSPESAGMTTLLDSLSGIVNGSLQLHEIMFTTDISGHHYIGFKCTSDPEMLNLVIDNVSITEQSDPDIAVLDILSPETGCNMETGTLSILLRNQCSQTLTDIPVSCNLNGNLIQETITASLSPGEYFEYTFDEDLLLSDFGSYSLVVYTSLPGDVDNINDSLNMEFSNIEAAEIPWSVPFDSETELSHWLIDNANEDNRTWEYTSGSGNESAGAMIYQYNDFEAADDWLISQCIYLETDMLYHLGFYTKIENATWPENLSVNLANVQSAEAMQDTIINLPGITDELWTEVSAGFQVDETGFYYIGFHCYSDAQMFNLYIDDIHITGDSIVQVQNPKVFTAQISPNPAKSTLNLDLNRANETKISIHNMRGQVLMQKTLRGKHNVLDIQGLPAGMYFLEMKQNGEILRKKFIKT